MTSDARLINLGIWAHAAAAVLGAAAGLLSMSGSPNPVVASGILLVVIGGIGFVAGLVSGGWAWMLVGGVERLQRAWNGLSSGLTLVLAYSFVAGGS